MINLKLWIITVAFLCLAVACNSDECNNGGDSFPSFPIYFNFQLIDGQNLFTGSDRYEFDNLEFVTSSISINSNDTTRLIRGDVHYYGIDWLVFKERSEVDFYFDFGNGDIDTLRIENASALGSFSENLNCAEGVVVFYYNSRLIQTWDFRSDNQLSRAVIVNADFTEPENPYSVAVIKDI